MLFWFIYTKLIYPQDKEIERDYWQPVTPGPFTTWTATLCGRHNLIMQPLYFFNKARGTFDSKGNYGSLSPGEKKEQHVFQLFTQYGITDRSEIDTQLNFFRNYTRKGNDSAKSLGISDTQLVTRHCLCSEEKYLPETTGFFQIRLPTGKYKNLDPDKLGTDLMGTGSFDFTFGFNLTKGVKPIVLHGDILYTISTSSKIDNNIRTRQGNKLELNTAGELPIKEGFNWMIEFNGILQGDTKENGRQIADSYASGLNLGTGLGWSTGKFQILFGYQRILIGKNIDANDSFALTFLVGF
jgi:hypothetical protein